MMAEQVDFLSREMDTHPVFVSAIAQFQLVRIHPFLDGNGRTSRLLSTLCLYRAIQGVREAGMDMTGWLEFYVDGLSTQLAKVRERGEQTIRKNGRPSLMRVGAKLK